MTCAHLAIEIVSDSLHGRSHEWCADCERYVIFNVPRDMYHLGGGWLVPRYGGFEHSETNVGRTLENKQLLVPPDNPWDDDEDDEVPNFP